ncbi:DUF2206 domain-containing protein [Salinirussus salinus]|uniref:DUF2206 domain-containing protein n=1 Tax=Salinirussus salinus TaxID=1198300 RepID=UPI001356C135|nr:DUF2206 domain-containing protein [Salinirussus salinus]
MISVSKRTLYAVLATASLGTAGVALLLPETLAAQLVAPASLLLVLLVPGLLGYLALTASDTVDIRATLYGFGLSAALLMALGFVVNLANRLFFIDPIRPLPVWISFAALLGVLGLCVERRVPGDRIDIALSSSPQPYLLATLPLAAAVGALVVAGAGTNVFVVLALGLVGLVYLLGAFQPFHRAMLIFAVALALLLHNSLISEFLLWGDQGKEANLVYTVLQAGHWDPSNLPKANKAVMLRIVLLHPLHSLLTGLEVRHVFKIAHPLLFATAPVALYRTFATRGRAQAGYLAAGALMFFFSFFTVLARNTRTAIAILFIILFVKVLLDADLAARTRRVLLVTFGTSVFVSHYGAGYMFLAILLGGFVVGAVGRRLTGQQARFHEHLTGPSVALIALIDYAWYTYAPPDAATLNTLVGFVTEFAARLQEGFFQPSNSATANYAASSFSSLSLNGIKLLTIVLFAVIGIGWLVAASRAVRGEDGIETNVSYLAMATMGGALAAVTLGPVERFNTARTIAVSLAVVAPLFAIGVEGILGAIPSRSAVPRWATTAACLAILLPFFIFSSGLLAATVTNDYSPNVLVYQDSVIREGNAESKSYLYKQTLPDTGARGGDWLARHGTGDVYGSGWPGNPTSGEIRGPVPAYDYHGNVSAATSDSCIYLSPLSVDAGVIRMPSAHLSNDFMNVSDLDTSARSTVYANGGATLMC